VEAKTVVNAGDNPDAILYANPVLDIHADRVWEEFFARAPEKRVRAGSVFSYMGPEHGIYFIKKGCIRFYAVSPKGTERTFCILGPGATFGEMNLVDPSATRWLATPLTDAVLGFIDINTGRRVVQERPELAWTIIAALTKRLKMIGKQMEDQCFRTVPSRVACLLLAQPQAEPDKAHISLTHDDIARFVGANRVTITRALRAMREDGLIDYDRSVHTVTILDRERLEELAAEEL